MRPLLRAAALLAAATALAAPVAAPRLCVQAVEFPYYLYPQPLWERELVWLKNIGIHTVEFSVPWNWHQVGPGEFDLTGRTNPRRDLAGLIRLLRRLGMQAWVRPLPPVPDWPNRGTPPGANAAAQRAWLRELQALLDTQTASHGGPVAFVEGRALEIDAPPPPGPVTVISASDPSALARSREALAAGREVLLWTGFADALYPAGWEPAGSALLRKGGLGLERDDPTADVALRRSAALLHNWERLFPGLRSAAIPKSTGGKLPEGVTVAEVHSATASAVSIVNRGAQPFHDDLRVFEPAARRDMTIPGVTVPAGQSLWLPLDVSLGQKSLCRECSNFSPDAHVVYATAELLAIEYENGILAMEFAAPEPAEVILQLDRKPLGPFLAAGKPSQYDWDDKTLRARFPIPANRSGDNHVRIGVAIEEPENSAFFDDARRLIIGQRNPVATSYSSSDVAARSRLRMPEGFTAAVEATDPGAIHYEVAVPPAMVPGDFANLALEADGMPLGRARLPLFRPVDIRPSRAVLLHIGRQTALGCDPPIVPVEPKAGSDVEFSIRNNSPAIRTYTIEANGRGLDFFPAKYEISIGAMAERSYSVRAFATDEAAAAGLRDWMLKVTGGASLEIPLRALLLPPRRTVTWSADLYGDGAEEWVLESPKVRAVFSSQDGGRWMEFTWKETGANFLPEKGAFAAAGPVEVHAEGDALEFTGKGWKRTARLSDATLTIDQSSSLPADGLAPSRWSAVAFSIERPANTKAVYTLRTAQN